MITSVIVVGLVLSILLYKSVRFFVRALSGHRLDLWQTEQWHSVSTKVPVRPFSSKRCSGI